MRETKRDNVNALITAIRHSAGETPPSMRSSIIDNGKGGMLVDSYIELVRARSYAITPEYIDALKQQGLSEDAIFETTIAAAASAAYPRYIAAMQALSEARG